MMNHYTKSFVLTRQKFTVIPSLWALLYTMTHYVSSSIVIICQTMFGSSTQIPKPQPFASTQLRSELPLITIILTISEGTNLVVNYISLDDYIPYLFSLVSSIEIPFSAVNGSICTLGKSFLGLAPYNMLDKVDCTQTCKDTFSTFADLSYCLSPLKSLYSDLHYQNIGSGGLDSLYNALQVGAPSLSILVPSILYGISSHAHNITVFMADFNGEVPDERTARRNRRRRLRIEFDGRLVTITDRINSARNHWLSFWEEVNSLRMEGVRFDVEPMTGEIDITVPGDATELVNQRADRLSIRANNLTAYLVDLADLMARNRFTAWQLRLDVAFVEAADGVLLQNLEPLLEQTSNIYSFFDFDERFQETLNRLMGLDNKDIPSNNLKPGNKRDRFDEDPDVGSSGGKRSKGIST